MCTKFSEQTLYGRASIFVFRFSDRIFSRRRTPGVRVAEEVAAYLAPAC